MARESAATWQQRLDREGTVVIRSRQHAAYWLLIGAVVVAVLGLTLALGGGIGGIVAGLLIAAAGGFGIQRAVRRVRAGTPHLVVTAERLEYAGRSVPWSTVNEVVRHTRTIRGDTTTHVWVLHGHHERLRLPTTLLADTWELGGWLSDIQARHSEVS